MRINKFLALNLNISRREADELIKKKEIKTNGKYAKLGQIVEENDIFLYKNIVINPLIEHQYYKFYKPQNYVSSRKSQGNDKTIYDLIKNKKLKYSGRLDKESEGLMLLSTDGNWLNEYSHPSKGLDKKYIITTNIEDLDLNKFKKTITINTEHLNIHSIEKISKFEYLVILKTGKNREIRKIFEYNNIKITKLKRISIGKFTLGNMKIGDLEQIKI